MLKNLKNILKQISIFYLILWIIISSWWYYYLKNNLTSTKSTSSSQSTSQETVEKWDIKETIDVVWTSELVDEQSLKFTKAWTVTKVNFKEWDKVSKWDIIAELDNTDWENSVKEAQINLDNANIALKQLYEWADESQIKQSQNSISNTKKSIEIAKEELENLKISQANSIESLEKNIENSQKDLASSEKSLELLKKDLELAYSEVEITKSEQSNTLSNTVSNRNTTLKQIEDSFSTELTNISKIIEQMDYILWVTKQNETKNDDFEKYLWTLNTSYKTNAESSLLSSITAYENLDKEIDAYSYDQNIDSLKEILTSISWVYKILEKATDYTYKTIEASVASDNFSQSEIDSKKSTIYSSKTSVQSKINSINSSINTLNTLTDVDLVEKSNNNTLTQKENSILDKEESIKSSELAIEKKKIEIDKLKKDLETTKKTYEINISSKEKSISDSEKSLEVSQLSLEELLEWPTDENIKKAKNSITQAQIKLESAKKSLDDYNLEAPFDWVIRKIDYMVWDNLSTDDNDKYVYIENPDLLEITVMLDQVDIAKVEAWTKAIVTFDAYPTEDVDAKISSIDTTPVQTSWVTTYTVTIVLDDDDFDKKILSWMTADVEIVTQEKNDILLVSTTAIKTENNKSYVTVLSNWVQKQVEVETWLASSWKTEITSWLSEWDIILVSSYTSSSTSTTETKTSTSLFPTWWWWNRSWAWWPPGWF